MSDRIERILLAAQEGVISALQTGTILALDQATPRRANVRGHGTEGITSMQPTGYCECGCGEKTTVPEYTDRATNSVRGVPRRFVQNHHSRLRRSRYVVEDRGYETPCWIHQGALDRRGYGAISLDGRTYKAHVFHWMKVNGPVPGGLQLDHLCEVTACVNPDHLEPVTAKENMLRTMHHLIRPTDHPVRHLRVALKLSQQDVADELGVNVRMVSHWDRGERPVPERYVAFLRGRAA